MGFSGLKIPGHSGTAVKNRKAFGSFKNHDKKSNSYDRDKKGKIKLRPNLAPKNYQAINRASSRNKKIVVPLLLIVIVTIFYMISIYFDYL